MRQWIVSYTRYPFNRHDPQRMLVEAESEEAAVRLGAHHMLEPEVPVLFEHRASRYWQGQNYAFNATVRQEAPAGRVLDVLPA
jgi:hypothetical protein